MQQHVDGVAQVGIGVGAGRHVAADNHARAHGLHFRHREIAHDAAVYQPPPVVEHRRKKRRNGHARPNSRHNFALLQHDGLAGNHVGGHAPKLALELAEILGLVVGKEQLTQFQPQLLRLDDATGDLKLALHEGQFHKVAAEVVLFRQRDGAQLGSVRQQGIPVELAGYPLNLRAGIPRRVERADHGPHARARDVINLHPRRIKGFE